jgi:glycosyltransferase 2 family protein
VAQGQIGGHRLTAPATNPTKPAAPARGSWGLALLMPHEPGRRNRRTIDGVLLAGGAFFVGLGAVIAESASAEDEEVEQALVILLGWAPVVWRAAVLGAIALMLVIVGAALFRRRWALVRDLTVACVAVGGLAVVFGRLVDADWLPVEADLLSRWGFPELRLAFATAVIVVARPELVQSVRKLATWLVPLAAVGVVALEAASPSRALSGVALGLGAAGLVRLAFGSAAGVPPTDRVRAALAALRVEVDGLRPSERQRIGAAEFRAAGRDGSSLKVRVLGRDAQDTQRLARRWRSLAYRDPPQSVGVGRREQVEHEALALVMAERARVRVPEIVAVGLGPDDDAVLVTREPDVEPLERSTPDQVSDETLEALWREVARLHAAGVSHGRLNASSVLVAEGRPMLVDLSAATLNAPQSSLDIDAAELLVACSVLVGPDRALRTAVDAGWGDSIARVLPYLQRAALTPHLRDLARTHEVGLGDLRAAAAAAARVEVPEIAPLRRVRPKDLLLTAFVIFAAYLLITQLAEIGFGTIARELGDADPAWVVVGLILAQCALVGSGISVRGAVSAPLPLLPCIVLQSAIKFINLTVPSSAGRIAMNLRFLQRMGVPRSEAAAAGLVDDASETMIQVALLLATLPLVGVEVDTGRFHGAGPDTRLLAAIVVAVVIAVVVVLTVPRLHAKVVPGIRAALVSLWSVARIRRKRVELFGGNVASEMSYALALGATCLAYGVDLNLAQLVFVNTAASVLSSLIPVPGGIGAAEAAISTGLIAMGVDESTAFAIALTQRLCTFYLPPVWGYVGLRWLARKGYV